MSGTVLGNEHTPGKKPVKEVRVRYTEKEIENHNIKPR